MLTNFDKALAGLITSAVAFLSAVGVNVPEWTTPEWAGAVAAAALGGPERQSLPGPSVLRIDAFDGRQPRRPLRVELHQPQVVNVAALAVDDVAEHPLRHHV